MVDHSKTTEELYFKEKSGYYMYLNEPSLTLESVPNSEEFYDSDRMICVSDTSKSNRKK